MILELKSKIILMMKYPYNLKIYSTLILIISFFTCYSQNQLTLENYKASMPNWGVNLDSVYVQSSETGKPILANFTGSDWCGWCIKLKNEVFSKPEFKEWASENVILLEIDFPRRFRLPETIAKQNRELQQSFGVRGYPTIWVFSIEKDKQSGQKSIKGLAQTGYVAGGPKAWINDLELKLAQQPGK